MEKTDRELLELAAKAAGIAGNFSRLHQAYGDQWVEGFDTGERLLWNPLIDNGDALRLAVTLGMMIDNIERGYMAGHILATSGPSTAAYEPRNPDPYAATRRAIVRAAAVIGESMGGADGSAAQTN